MADSIKRRYSTAKILVDKEQQVHECTTSEAEHAMSKVNLNDTSWSYVDINYRNSVKPQQNAIEITAPDLSEPDLFNQNAVWKKASLNSKENKKCDMILIQVYHSKKCCWFYMFVLSVSIGLIFLTIFDGFKVAALP